jgi:S1/P1 Nuclease
MKTLSRKTRFRCAFLKAIRCFAALPFLCGVSMIFAAPSAWAFGCQAHEIIALIAQKHLSPRALAMVEKILKENPIDPALVRYCKQPDFGLMATSATWADDYRSIHRETSAWHQIDIPILIDKGNLMDYCPPVESCLPQALKNQIAILRAADSDAQKRAGALRYVIHFVGDLHAPLHTANNNDLGGNCIPVTFFNTEPKLTNAQYETYAPNLHAMWDYGIYQREFKDPNLTQTDVEYRAGYEFQTVQKSADQFDSQFASQEVKWMKERIEIDAWTWETFGIAKSIVYGKLPIPVPVEKPVGNHSCADDDHVSNRMLKLNERLEEPYEDVALPVYEQQLAKAGARLALVLNQIWR